MDATGLLSLSSAILFLLSAPLSFLSACGVASAYSLDVSVPSCSGTACAKYAYPFDSEYSYYVGMAWSSVNDVRRKLSMVRSACSLDFYDENGNLLWFRVNELLDAAESLHRSIKNMTYRVNRANEAAFTELRGLSFELTYAGIEESTEPEWLDLYNEIVLAVKDINEGEDRTDVGAVVRELRDISNVYMDVQRLELVVNLFRFPFGIEIIPPFFPLSLIDRAYDLVDLVVLAEGLDKSLDRYVDLSVGTQRSLLVYIKNLRLRFENLKKTTDEAAKNLKKEFSDTSKELRKRVEPLVGEEDLSVLVQFLPTKTFVGELQVKMSLTPSFVLSKLNGLERNFYTYWNYYTRGYKYLSSYEKMKYYYNKLLYLKTEVEKFLNTIEASLDECVGIVSSYRFRDPALEGEAAVYLSIAKDKDRPLTIRIRSCSKSYEIMGIDRERGDLLGAFESCKEEFEKRWSTSLNCSHEDPYEAYLCCKTESERALNDFLSSEAYLRYKSLYETLEAILIDMGASDLLLELYKLPRVPYNYEELHRVYSKLLALLEDVKEVVSPYVGIEWEGYLSTDLMTEVRLTVSNPLPIPVEGSIEVPFDFYGYVVEGNGMVAYISGGKVNYRGQGSVTVTFQVPPVDVKKEVTGYVDGFVELVLENPYMLPLKVYAPYGVASLSSGGSYSGGYAYVPPYGYVVVREPALEVDRYEDNDYVVFVIRNVSPYTYKGTVSLSVSAESVPPYCYSSVDVVVCKVNVSPGEEKIIKFKGLLREDNGPLLFKPPEGPPPPSDIIESIPIVPSKPEEGDNRFEELVERLKEYLERARELNAVDVLPYTEDFLDRIVRLDEDLRRAAVPLLESIDESIRSEAEARTELLEVLAKRTDDPELGKIATVAKKSLLSGDYVTPLALSRITGLYLYPKREEMDLSIVLVLVAVALAVYVITKRDVLLKRKKKRIPRF